MATCPRCGTETLDSSTEWEFADFHEAFCLLQMQEDVQGILSKRKAESYYTQTFWTNVSFRVSARALIKKQEKRSGLFGEKGDYSLCRVKRALPRNQK